MGRLNGLTLTPDEARTIVKSLTASHGLAPGEGKAISYMSEHRIVDEDYPDENMHTTCASCHPFGRVASFRRSPEEWKLLIDLHVALYPVVGAYCIPPVFRSRFRDRSHWRSHPTCFARYIDTCRLKHGPCTLPRTRPGPR